MKRRSRPVVSLLALFALVFAQMLASVHACEVMDTMAKAPVTASATDHPASDCCDNGPPAPDPACDNHCQAGNAAPDRTQTTAPAAAAAPSLALPTLTVGIAAESSPPPRAITDPARPTEPALSIRNCCFRI